jgi:hypothetical protein
MSTDLINKVWANFPGGGSELAVLMAIAEACNSEGNCGVPLAKLAGFARVSTSTAFVAVKSLRAQRWIVTSRIGRGILVMQLHTPKLRLSKRPDYDPDPPESDAVHAARTAKQRRESRMARSAGKTGSPLTLGSVSLITSSTPSPGGP